MRRYIILLELGLFLYVSGFAQTHEGACVGNPYNFIFFEFGSYEIDSTQLEILICKSISIKKAISDSDAYYLKIEAFYCENEERANPFIGVQRARNVQAAMQKHMGWKASKFYISDNGPSKSFSNKVENSCDLSAVNISILSVYD